MNVAPRGRFACITLLFAVAFSNAGCLTNAVLEGIPSVRRTATFGPLDGAWYGDNGTLVLFASTSEPTEQRWALILSDTAARSLALPELATLTDPSGSRTDRDHHDNDQKPVLFLEVDRRGDYGPAEPASDVLPRIEDPSGRWLDVKVLDGETGHPVSHTARFVLPTSSGPVPVEVRHEVRPVLSYRQEGHHARKLLLLVTIPADVILLPVYAIVKANEIAGSYRMGPY